MGFVNSRDALARRLIRAGVTPNHLTFLGFLMTLAAGWFLARGASQQVPYFHGASGPVGWSPMLAGVFLVLSGACDMLDGAVARLGNMSTPFGQILDSVLDRFSDMAIYIGCAWHFAWQGNVTYQLLAVLALCNACLISYIKARAENLIPDCSVGYWLRGERFAAVLIGCATGHVPAVLWQQALSPFFTVMRRVSYSARVVQAMSTQGALPVSGPAPGWRGRLQLWRHPRGSISYDLVTGFNIAYIVFAARFWPELLATGASADPLRQLLG
jgi:CDP-diacylglycerol---glycerol-3-phosphate 3-phosphatidyltransferase